MSNVAKIDISEMMRRDDEEFVELVKQWEATCHKYLAEREGRLERVAQIEAIEGQIARHTPTTFRGLGSILHMAHTILSARDANPDCYIADGPATILVARAITATAYSDGVIDRTKT